MMESFLAQVVAMTGVVMIVFFPLCSDGIGYVWYVRGCSSYGESRIHLNLLPQRERWEM